MRSNFCLKCHQFIFVFGSQFTDQSSGKPSKPGPPKITDSDEKSCTFKWENPESGGSSHITHWIIERKHNGKDWETLDTHHPPGSLTYKDNNLSLGDKVQYRCTAVNEVGPSRPSEPCPEHTVKPVITSCHDIKKINDFTDPSKICKIINCLKQGNQRSKECEDEITLEEVEIIDNIRDETIITKIIREIITSCEDITKLNDITDRSKICHIIDCFSGHPCEDEVDLTDWQQITNINEITNKTIIKKILDDITKGPGKPGKPGPPAITYFDKKSCIYSIKLKITKSLTKKGKRGQLSLFCQGFCNLQ